MAPQAQKRKQRHTRIRKKIRGTAERPRLSVFRSNQHVYAQVIDDDAGHTLVSGSTIDTDMRDDLTEKRRLEQAREVGMRVAERAQEEGIQKVVFDRSGYQYHGVIKAIAEGAREGGLEF